MADEKRWFQSGTDLHEIQSEKQYRLRQLCFSQRTHQATSRIESRGGQMSAA